MGVFMNISYDYYAVFYHVAKYGSFTKAANALFLNQPNLTRTIKSLEEKLDLVTNKQHSPIQVPMVAGSPLGATQTCNKVRW